MLKVCHLYPDLLNLYGDRGNIIAFVQRCRWRGIPVEVLEVNIGEQVDFADVDFLFLGGGSDREQNLMAADLLKRKASLQQAIEEGLVVLAICGGYQMLGQYYLTHEGKQIPGLGILNLYTRAGQQRLIGNVIIEANINGQPVKMAGFENHSGQTFIGDLEPLGKVLSGFGNNGQDGYEGARYKNVFCSYLHGPLLPKNSKLTDLLISLALQRRGMDITLTPLNDDLENSAVEVIVKRYLK
ncbi:CobB/CobQ domain protein glutamine amidotransferase [Desulfotomaculum nigrificans CO-1-SRB]|uniref:Lipid II isoglutaminyl synthase (glutamine-hydrolyzing) subunit GatD n=1 Tax=Desulfotomaculum nigrificans (strain DSM 14880 / VKM B-2319 / CO-1-SRB) TaxID=868595 RepID=F6B3J4_DESCC|nr:glutamine amidotransferase [Desulfotomaculum nigrificans]AEF94023.1 CobB/CobQ domain protein glutamine amidotransferase [Desulfotomaculum nigrificans CO-1-SRB]